MSGATVGNVIYKPGLIGWGQELPSESCLSQLSSTECITHISSGWYHSAVVCASGHVYTLGNNNYHKWMKKNTINEPTLVRDLISHKITQTACGLDSTFFLTDQGQLFSSGTNSYGELGLGSFEDCRTPVIVRDLPRVKKVVAIWLHTVVLTESGEVWVCGRNSEGQLGLSDLEKTSTFIRVSYLTKPIIDISCGEYVTTLLTASGDLMMTALREYNQMGLSYSLFHSVTIPYTTIAAVACGSEHTVALAVDGSVWVWGDNRNGQLGVDTTIQQLKMESLENYKIASVFAGYEYSALVTEQGDMFICSCGVSGELGQERTDISTLTLLKKSPGLRVRQIVFGPNYSLLNVTQEHRTSPSEDDRQTVERPTDHETLDSITDMERTIMKALECPVCFNIMSSPIHLCCNGHTLCENCYASPRVQACPTCREGLISTRCPALEYISSQVELPCSQCLRRMPVTALNFHDNVCPKRPFKCPVEESCTWNGRLESMLDHLCSKHPEKTWQPVPHTFLHNLEDADLHTDILVLDGELFVFRRQSTRKVVWFSVQYIGLPHMATKFKFRVVWNFDNDDWNQSISNSVCSLYIDIKDVLKSPVAVYVTNNTVKHFLQNNIIPCRVSVLKICD